MDPSTNNKVLIADDDPVGLRVLSDVLIEAGYDVTEAKDGQQALHAIERACPDFLVTDWEMPNMDGLALCRQVREMQLPHYVFVMLVSGRSRLDDVIQGLEAGANDFLIKPVSHAELLARLHAGRRVLDLERRLSQEARTDSLTGLDTKRTFSEHLTKAWERARRYEQPLSCVLLDADFFKRINDSYGHPAGDQVLKAIAETLKVNRRAADFLCRFGGEEFVALLPETDEENATWWAERLRSRVSELKFTFGGKKVRITCSFGVSQQADGLLKPEELIQNADQALLVAKQSGRDRVVSFSAVESARVAGGALAGTGENLFEGLTARDVMTSLVSPLGEDETVGQAAGHFLRSRMSSAPVVNASGRLVGILSEKDLMHVIATPLAWTNPVREVMKPNVVCYEQDAPLGVIHEFLCRVSIRQVVIVEDGRPVGCINRGNLVRWFSNWIEYRRDDFAIPAGDDAKLDRGGEKILGISQKLADEAALVRRQLAEGSDDMLPALVTGASRLQELVNDMLACSRHLHATRSASREEPVA